MASDPYQYLRLYNTRVQPCGEFHAFNRLPSEVRLYIWEMALPRERFLRIRLSPSSCSSQVSQSVVASTDRKDSKKADGKYQVTVEGSKLVPKILHVCQEARYASLKFYRVQVPCHYESGDKSAKGVFYMNPEFDILKVHAGRNKDNFIRFIKDLQVIDPSKKGLTNLALDNNDMNCIRSCELDEMDVTSRQSFIDTLSNLRQVFFLCLETTGRMFLGPLNGVMAIKGWEMHRSRPILGSVPSFRRLDRDPRSIEKDLARVFMGTFDPRQMFFSWKRLLQQCEIKQTTDIRYRFMVSCSPEGPHASIVDRQSAERAIEYEDEQWRKGLDMWEQTLGKVDRETQAELEEAPQPAVGFWLFPLEALGSLPGEDQKVEDADAEAETIFKPKRVEDLSNYHPELGLFDL